MRACHFWIPPLLQVLSDDSEVMFCDFSDPMELVTFLNVIPKDQSTMRRNSRAFRLQCLLHLYPSPRQAGVAPSRMDTAFFPKSFFAGGCHDQAPGETRVHPDYAGLVTFYDTSLTSLVEARHGKDRLLLRLEGIFVLDSESVRTELRTVLTRERGRYRLRQYRASCRGALQ